MSESQPVKRPVRASAKPLVPLTNAQRHYDAAIAGSDLVFGIGPAGTGKTWWAAMRAAEALKNGDIERIIVTRPAVEAGESLGFLPGELDEKYEPYFRPVRDALEESLGSGHLEYALDNGQIEARPLALLRGATLKHAYVIADEMQNATVTQMKLFLTRIGEGAKFIINGDPEQCDLPDPSKSGLEDAVRRLQHLRQVRTIVFTEDDVVRSGLCQEIVRAYGKPRATAPTGIVEIDGNLHIHATFDAAPLPSRYNELEHMIETSPHAAGLRRVLGVANDTGDASPARAG